MCSGGFGALLDVGEDREYEVQGSTVTSDWDSQILGGGIADLKGS